MQPGTHDIEHYSGDSFLGINFQLFDEADVAVDLTGATALLQLRKNYGLPVALEWKSSDNTIEITGNTVKLLPRTATVMSIEAYKYFYDLQVTHASGEVRTYVIGKFSILNDITR
jgi:hypothetical protein